MSLQRRIAAGFLQGFFSLSNVVETLLDLNRMTGIQFLASDLS
jgi:hypothetical protein